MKSALEVTCVTAVFQAIKSGNRENLIRCVKSVSNLSISHEHLIYDGGSTDGTIALLQDLAMTVPGLRVVSERDNGIYDALNKGVRDAKGEWYYVLGCDDYIARPDAMYLALRFGNAKKADLVGSPIFENQIGVSNTKWKLRNFLFGNPFPHQGILMRTSQIRALGGFDAQYRVAADFDLIQRAILSGIKVVESGKPYACFSLNGVSSKNDGIDLGLLERAKIVSDRFGLTEKESLRAIKERVLPLRIIVNLILKGNYVTLKAGWYNLIRSSILHCIKLQ